MIYLVSGATETDRPFVLYGNRLAAGVFSSTGGLATGAAPDAVLGPQTFDFWQPVTVTGVLTCTLPAPETWDCVCLSAHNLHKLGVDFTVETSPDLVSSWTAARVLTAAELAANGAAALGIIMAGRTVRRWRAYAASGAAVAPKIGIAFAGARMVFPGDVQPPYVPMTEAQTVDFSPSISLGGHLVGGTIQRQALQQDVTIAPLTRAFMDGALAGFSRHFREGGTFFFGGSPSYMPGDIGYCWRGSRGELRPAYRPGGKIGDVTLGLAGYGA